MGGNEKGKEFPRWSLFPFLRLGDGFNSSRAGEGCNKKDCIIRPSLKPDSSEQSEERAALFCALMKSFVSPLLGSEFGDALFGNDINGSACLIPNKNIAIIC